MAEHLGAAVDDGDRRNDRSRVGRASSARRSSAPRPSMGVPRRLPARRRSHCAKTSARSPHSARARRPSRRHRCRDRVGARGGRRSDPKQFVSLRCSRSATHDHRSAPRAEWRICPRRAHSEAKFNRIAPSRRACLRRRVDSRALTLSSERVLQTTQRVEIATRLGLHFYFKSIYKCSFLIHFLSHHGTDAP